MPEKGAPLCPKSKPKSLRPCARKFTRKKEADGKYMSGPESVSYNKEGSSSLGNFPSASDYAFFLKMLAVMESRQQSPAGGEPSSSHSQEFLTSGRTGRRNALPDILSEHAVVSSADLPARLQKLTTQDGAGPSTSDAPGPSKDPKQANNGS